MHVQPSIQKHPALRRLLGLLATSTALIAPALLPAPARANPEGGRVVSGEARIVDQGQGRLEVRQTSRKAIIDWRRFSIDRGEHTHFAQPGRDAVALNRVTGKEGSTIAGRLSADGRIVLVNPNGIVFTESAKVDVAGLIASTGRLDDRDFLEDRYRFRPSGNPDAAVVNRGEITARDGGLIALVSPWVENSGTISARLGRVALASGEAVTVDLYGDGLIRFEADPKAQAKGILQAGTIRAEGGMVQLSIAEAGAVLDRAVNVSGIVEAKRVAAVGGRIVLDGGDGGAVQVAGRLDAAGGTPTDTGGEVALAGGRIELAATARIDASGPAGGGTVKLGGGWQGTPPIPEARPARTVEVAAGAVIDADAKVRGTGGTVVAWSEAATRFAGTATARGGPAGGDGGRIETSGRGVLDTGGALVDASAAAGRSGAWLLDPEDITIDAARADAITRALDAGTDVTVRTSDVGEGAGDILVEAEILKTAGGPATLTLDALRDLLVNQFIGDSGEGGSLALDLLAGRDIAVDDSTLLLTSGPIELRAGRDVVLPGIAVASDADVTIAAGRDLEVRNFFSALFDEIEIPGPAVTAGGDLGITAGGAVRTVSGETPAAHLAVAGDLAITANGIGDGESPLLIDGGGPTGRLVLVNGAGAVHAVELDGAVGNDDVGGGPGFAAIEVRLTGADQSVDLDLAGGGVIRADADGTLRVETVRADGRDVTLATDLSMELSRGSIDLPGGALALETGGALLAGEGGDGVSPHLSADAATLVAVDGIGVAADGIGSMAEPLRTDIATLDARNSNSGGIHIRNEGFVGEEVTIKGDLTVTALAAPGQDVDLAAGHALTRGTLEVLPDLVDLGSLALAAADIRLHSVTTTGDQTYVASTLDASGETLGLGTITLASSYVTNGGDWTADGNVRLEGAATRITTAGGGIGVTGTIDGTETGQNDLTLEPGRGTVQLAGAIGGEVGLGTLALLSEPPPDVTASAAAATAGRPVPLDITIGSGFVVQAVELRGLPPGTVVAFDEQSRTAGPDGTVALPGFAGGQVTLTLPSGTTGSVPLTVAARGFDGEQVSLPETIVADDVIFPEGEAEVSLEAAPEAPAAPPPVLPPNIAADAATRPEQQGLIDAIRNAEPARLPDLTPIVPRPAAAILAAAPTAAGPEAEAESPEAAAERERELARTFEPWEACPEVGAVSLAWQNTPADAAFNHDPTMLPYTVDVYCGGYQFAGPDRGAADAYQGLTFVTRDYWTDLRQERTPRVLEELRQVFGLPPAGAE
jgi:filamentous hemagglutinin family protein